MDFAQRDATEDRFVPGWRTLIVPFMLLVAFSSATAQTGQSTIIGTVEDASGAHLPGVSITITNEDTIVSKAATTNTAGLYDVPFLAAGRYTVRAELSGFATLTNKGIEVDIRQVARVDLKLKPALIDDPGVVESTQPFLSTDSTEVGRLVTWAEVAEMPLLTRDFASLQILSPGAVPGSSVGSFAGRELSPGFRVAGGTMYSGSFSVEGADNNRDYYYGNASSPSLEIIRGVQIQTAGAPSEYGGGTHHVDVSLKGGGNRFHASLFEYMQHDKLSAGNAFSSSDPPHLRRNQYGASFSGPLRKDRIFFFGVYEGTRQREGAVVFTQVASPDQRNGIFPLSGTDAVEIKDPLTNKPFPGNQVPANRVSPVAKYFLDHVWPLPNSGPQLYQGYDIPVMDSDQFDLKFDYARDKSNTACFRFSRQTRVFDEEIDKPIVSPRKNSFNNLFASISYTRIISPTMVNSLLISARRDYNTLESYSDLGNGVRFIESIGMNLDAPHGAGYPAILIRGKGFSGRTGSYNTPNEHSANVFHYRDTFRWMRGRHGVNLGFEVKRFQNSEMDEGTSRGQISFNGRYTGSGLADFLLGLPNQFTFSPEWGTVYLRNTLWSAYAQDDWKIRDNLTLNLGLRYEYVSWPTELYDRMATSHPELGMKVIVSSDTGRLPLMIDPLAVASYPAGTFVTSQQAGLPRSLRFPDRNNFAPRVGFAYRPAQNLVIRAGYGIDYVNNTQSVFNDRNASFGLPFRITRTVINPSPLNFDLLQPLAGYSPGVQNRIESAWYIDPHFVMAFVQSWSLNVERRLPARSVLQIGYVGDRMVHGKQIWNWNQSLAWPNRNDRYPGYTNITALTNGADSRYDSLQIQLRKELTRGLLANAHYTWSKTLTNVVDEGGPNSIWAHNPAMQWGRSPWDRAHFFTGNFVYRLPVGKDNAWLHSMHPVFDGILGGWQISGIMKIWSGIPLTITSSQARATLSVQGNVPADRLADGRLDPPTRSLWFDTSAFATPPANRPGNAGYGVIDGPGIVTEDLGLYKTLRIRDGAKVQLRLEAYNAFNHVNLGNPFTDVDNRSFFGKILSSGPALRIQAAMRIEF